MNVLFVSMHGGLRCRMAAAVTAATAGAEGWNIGIAGIEPSPMDSQAAAIMAGLGLATAPIPAPVMPAAQAGAYDIVVAVGSDTAARCPVFAAAPALVCWDIPAPAGTTEQACRACADTVRRHVDALTSCGFAEALVQQRMQRDFLLDSLSEGIIAHDLDRKIFLVSRGVETITGLKREEIIGRDCHEVFAPHFCGEQCRFTAECDRAHVTAAAYPALYRTPDGQRREFSVSRRPLKNGNGELFGAVTVVSDQTPLRELERTLETRREFNGIIGQDHAMQQIYDLIRDSAQSDFPVLIMGESGTGKELVAGAIHRESARRDRLFVPVNCAALPEALLESELFGHVKGAFTGAIRDKKGRFELADGGSLFLDEIGELSPLMQVKLLRVLQEGAFEPVGGEIQKKVDVRIISATNRDLRAMVADGRFREDLYYRLAVVPIEVPPLRERRNDIAMLADHFLKLTSDKLGRSGMALSPRVTGLFLNYAWPGNIRQLHNAIQFSMVKCRGTLIEPDHMPPEILKAVPRREYAEQEGDRPKGPGRRPKLDVGEVSDALRRTGGNKAKTARILGVGRATLYNFLDAHPQLRTLVSD